MRGPAARPLALRDRSRAHAFLGTRRESRPFNVIASAKYRALRGRPALARGRPRRLNASSAAAARPPWSPRAPNRRT
ncbi:hypothetical protein ACX83E_30125, partial [Burkholderia pseudomallei]